VFPNRPGSGLKTPQANFQVLKYLQICQGTAFASSRHDHDGFIRKVTIAKSLLKRPLPIFQFGLEGMKMATGELPLQGNRGKILLVRFRPPRQPYQIRYTIAAEGKLTSRHSRRMFGKPSALKRSHEIRLATLPPHNQRQIPAGVVCV